MTARSRAWLRAGLSAFLCALGSGWALLVQAQTSTAAPPAASSATYIDRVLEDSGPSEAALALKATAYDATGWPRSWRVDYSLLDQRAQGSSNQTRGASIAAFLDTPNYGSLSLSASNVAQRADSSGNLASSSGSTFRLDQRALPLDGGWYADHAAGDINTTRTPLARGTGRISLPTSPVRGLAGEWIRAGDASSLNATVGSTGLYNGSDINGFQTSGGRVATAGGQFRLGSQGGQGLQSAQGRQDIAIQALSGRGIADGGGQVGQDTQALWAATAWEGAAPWADGLGPANPASPDRSGSLRVQANAMRSQGSRDGPATGLWADALWRTDRWRNTAGVFRFDPNLRWGTSLIASDLQGFYWQGDTSTRQWQAGYALELTDSVSATGAGRSAYLSATGRYSTDTRNTLGASLSLRAITSPGQAAQLTWDRRSDWGQTQWRADLSRALYGRTTRLGVEQAWAVAYPATFATSLAWERISGNAMPSTGWIWGVLGSAPVLQQWSLDASVRGANRSDGARSLNANIGLAWKGYEGWSLALRYTATRGQEPLSPLVLSALSAATLPAVIVTPSSRGLQLLLRYEGNAGSATAPIGGTPGTGSGGIAGTVYFDEDNNGRRGATEGGVPAVTIILDRRYVTRTDAQGRYEFPYVAAGDHLIEISADNVPLPWTPVSRAPQRTSVFVRQQGTLDFPVQRER
jgi:hypothetical protein